MSILSSCLETNDNNICSFSQSKSLFLKTYYNIYNIVWTQDYFMKSHFSELKVDGKTWGGGEISFQISMGHHQEKRKGFSTSFDGCCNSIKTAQFLWADLAEPTPSPRMHIYNRLLWSWQQTESHIAIGHDRWSFILSVLIKIQPTVFCGSDAKWCKWSSNLNHSFRLHLYKDSNPDFLFLDSTWMTAWCWRDAVRTSLFEMLHYIPNISPFR